MRQKDGDRCKRMRNVIFSSTELDIVKKYSRNDKVLDMMILNRNGF